MRDGVRHQAPDRGKATERRRPTTIWGTSPAITITHTRFLSFSHGTICLNQQTDRFKHIISQKHVECGTTFQVASPKPRGRGPFNVGRPSARILHLYFTHYLITLPGSSTSKNRGETNNRRLGKVHRFLIFTRENAHLASRGLS